MRVFVAGASGAIGTRLVPQLIDRGHEVIGTATSLESAKRISALGAEAIVLDLLDQRTVREPCSLPSLRRSPTRRPHWRT